LEQIGQTLKNARLDLNLKIKDVVEETNISPVFLKALEAEEFDKFPSEIYLIGFLRAYAQFLGLDPQKVIQAYKGHKIAESETPLEELTKPTSFSWLRFFKKIIIKNKVILSLLGVIIFSVVAFLIFKKYLLPDINLVAGSSIEKIKEEYNQEIPEQNKTKVKILDFRKDKGFILVSEGEEIEFEVDNQEVSFIIQKIEEQSIEIKFLPNEVVQKIQLDKKELFQVKTSPRKIYLTLKGLTENRAKIKAELGDKNSAFKEEPTSNLKTKVYTRNPKDLKIVFEVFFVQKSFIELYLDGVQKARGFFAKGEKVKWEAVEYIQIKIGNAGGLKTKINNKKYTFGLPGQVVNKVITWERDKKDSNLYEIIVKDW